MRLELWDSSGVYWAFSNRRAESALLTKGLVTNLTVTPVKTYKDAVPRGEPVLVHAD
jgi:hypothetical protein